MFLGLLAVGAAAPASAAVRNDGPRFQGSLHLGIGRPTLDDRRDFDFGPSLALQLGARVAPFLSLQARLGFALLNADLEDTTVRQFQVGFVPLLHPLGDRFPADLFLGPSIGYYRRSLDGQFQWGPFSGTFDGHEDDLFVGLLVGASFPVGRLSLGFAFNYEWMFADERCGKAGGISGCFDDPRDRGFMGLSFLLGF